MRQKTTLQRNHQDLVLAPSAGSHGLAIAPPAYDLQSIDNPITEAISESVLLPNAPLQMKAGLPASATSGAPESAPQNRTGLPDALKTGIESLSGLSLNDVRVYYNSSRPAQLQALAYAQGVDIHVAPRQERHLPHEAWHVVQQKQGRVRPTMQSKSGIRVNDDNELEHEADVMGSRAKQVHKADADSSQVFKPSKSSGGSVVQAISEVRYGNPLNYQYAMPPGVGGALNTHDHVARRMSADLDLTDPIRGSGVGAGIPANLMTDLAANFPADIWIQGHLLNSELGGLGIATNLFPITGRANMQHYHAVETKVKQLLYQQPPGGNFALNADGYVQYEVDVNPLAVPPTTHAPDADYACRYRTQNNQMAPAAFPMWNPWVNFTVHSRGAAHAATPAAWAPFGAGIGMPLGGGGIVNVQAWHANILTNVHNPNHGAMLAALGLAVAPAIPAGATHFLTQQPHIPGPALKIIGWQF